jgi:glycine cleavage system H protein
MPFLELTIDKFIFRVDPDCYYSAEGVWVKIEKNMARIGLSDFMQQRSGDIAFVDIKKTGTELTVGDYFSTIETIKVNVDLISPVSGKIVLLNPALQFTPELINQDPYGEGWLCEVEMDDWKKDKFGLLDPGAYFEIMKRDAEEEAKKL